MNNAYGFRIRDQTSVWTCVRGCISRCVYVYVCVFVKVHLLVCTHSGTRRPLPERQRLWDAACGQAGGRPCWLIEGPCSRTALWLIGLRTSSAVFWWKWREEVGLCRQSRGGVERRGRQAVWWSGPATGLIVGVDNRSCYCGDTCTPYAPKYHRS